MYTKKMFAASVLSAFMILAFTLPSFTGARPFESDDTLRVYPENEIIYFNNTKVGETVTKYFTVENTSNSSKTTA